MNLLTPNFHPASGIIPTTHADTRLMIMTAIVPMTKLNVVKIRIAQADDRPTRIPITAELARV